jgi:hypothetical protein
VEIGQNKSGTSTTSVVGTAFAFIADGQLFVQRGGAAREIRPEFARRLVERDAASRERNAWKQRGSGNRFMNPWAQPEVDAQVELPIYITSVSAGSSPLELICTLESPGVCALLRLELGDEPGEQRLRHSADSYLRDVARHPTADRLACSLQSPSGLANIAIASADGAGLGEVTEGDSLDQGPSWVPGSPDELIFQSAGIARTHDGVAAGTGPFRIERINVLNGEHQVAAEQDGFDLLAPRMDGEGRLHFIRRPYQSQHSRSWSQTALDVVLLPYRLLQLLFAFLNFLSAFFSGKPLIQYGDTRAGKVDARQWFLWGRMIDAEKALRAAKSADAPNLVPDNWHLVRQEKDGADTVLARGVAGYDLLPGGAFIFTNGTAVFRCSPDGSREVLARHKLVQQVVALPPLA